MNSPRVLVVDDNLMNLEMASFVLQADGFTIETALDAAMTLSVLQRFQPDLILMDIQLPGMDGLELTRQLKSEPRTQSILVVAFTAYAMKGDEAKMRAAGCDGYIAKPIDVGTFAGQVRACLGRTR